MVYSGSSFPSISSREEISTNLNSINFLSVFGRTVNFDHSSQGFCYLMIVLILLLIIFIIGYFEFVLHFVVILKLLKMTMG